MQEAWPFWPFLFFFEIWKFDQAFRFEFWGSEGRLLKSLCSPTDMLIIATAKMTLTFLTGGRIDLSEIDAPCLPGVGCDRTPCDTSTKRPGAVLTRANMRHIFKIRGPGFSKCRLVQMVLGAGHGGRTRCTFFV